MFTDPKIGGTIFKMKVKLTYVRRHLELQTGWKSFISNTKCGLKFGFLTSQTNGLKRKYLKSHIFTGRT